MRTDLTITTLTTSLGFLLNLALYGALFVLWLYLQQIHHWSPWRSGIALLPFAVTIFAAKVAAGRLTAAAAIAAGFIGTDRLAMLSAVARHGQAADRQSHRV